jgi:hypothetical protein
MKVFKKFITISLLAIIAWAGTLFATEIETINSTKVAAISQIMRKQNSTRENCDEDSPLLLVKFRNGVPSLVALQKGFENIEYSKKLIAEHFDLMINNQIIQVNESKPLAIRTDKHFTVGIKLKRFKLASLLDYIKSSAQSVYAKVCNLFTLDVEFDCSIHKDLIYNGTIEIDELLYLHPVVLEILKNPADILNKIKPYLTWSSWFGFKAKLPELKLNNS